MQNQIIVELKINGMNNIPSKEDQLALIQSKIYEVRGVKVMLDKDLAELYHVTTGNLNKAVKRNIRRFPSDFMFQLTKEEWDSLRFQIGILEVGRGKYTKFLPHAFTEQGLAMLSGVLNSDIAIDVNSSTLSALHLQSSKPNHLRQNLTSPLASSNQRTMTQINNKCEICYSCRRDNVPSPHSVANPSPCRNNSDKNLAISLESA